MVKKICLSDLLIVRIPGLDYPGYLKQNKNQLSEPFKSKFDLIQRDLLVTLINLIIIIIIYNLILL